MTQTFHNVCTTSLAEIDYLVVILVMMADRNREGSKRESRLDDRVDRVFLELLGADRMVGRSGTAFRPNADVYYSRSQEAILVKLELPGVDPEAVRLEAKGKTLIVTGQRKDPEHRDKAYHQMEVSYGAFARRIPLPVEVDTGAARARYERGFLEITLPLPASSEPRQIPIEYETQDPEE